MSSYNQNYQTKCTGCGHITDKPAWALAHGHQELKYTCQLRGCGSTTDVPKMTDSRES